MKINNLTPHLGALNGSEPVPTVKDGSKRITTAQIAALGEAVGIEGAAVIAAIWDALNALTPTDEGTSASLYDLVRPAAAGPREALVYNDSDSVRLFSRHAIMGGFRIRGQYTRGPHVPSYPMPASKIAQYNPVGCPSMATVKTETWVGVFAVANSGDLVAAVETMPFLRVGEPVGLTCPIIKGGEGVHDLVTPAAHDWVSANNLAGTEVLIISENGGFSDKVATITGNTNTSITFDNVHGLAAGDFVLPAPPGWDHFRYLGSFYFDTAEVRNFYDTGTIVKGKMVYITSPDVSVGSEPAPGQIMNCAGYISPLATGVIIDSVGALSTAAMGQYAEYFDPDGANHIVDSRLHTKNSATTEVYVFSNIQVPFLYHQKFNYYNGGAIAGALINGQLNVTGWFEP